MQTVYDVEVFKKMNMAGFVNFSGKAFYIVNASNLPDEKIDSEYGTIFINKYPTKPIYEKLNGIIGFMNHNYDDFLIDDILQQRPTEYIKMKSDVIVSGKRPRQQFDWWSYDLSETLPLGFSVKKYEAMAGLSVEESSIPFDYDGEFTKSQIMEVVKYNHQDLKAELDLYNTRATYFDGKDILVDEYGTEKMHRYSNTTISANYLMGNDKLDKFTPDNPKIYGVPEKVDEFLNNALEASPRVSKGDTAAIRQKLKTNEWANEVTSAFGQVFTWGWGGLHSATGEIYLTKTGKQRVRYFPVDETGVQQWDVASMFPNIIIRDNLLGSKTDKYKKLVDERLENKRKGLAVAGAQKIVVNAVYGALRLQTSKLFNPHSAIAVNVSGMVALYNLAGRLADYGTIIQTNTDGIAFKPFDTTTQSMLDELRTNWEDEFQLELEVTNFKRFIQRDVNNYVAVDENDHIKTKGGTVGQSVHVNKLAKSGAIIIDKMVLNYLLDKTDPAITALKGELSDFTYTLVSQKGKTQTGRTVDENGKPLDNKVNRVYASLNGVSLFKERVNGSLAKFSDAPEKMAVVNDDLANYNVDDIDYGFYIDLANKKIKDWFKNA